MRLFNLIMAIISILLSIFALISGEVGHATYLLVMAVYWRVSDDSGASS